MNIKLELSNFTKSDMQKNIDALDRAIKGKPRCSDFMLLIDTKSILEAIQNQAL